MKSEYHSSTGHIAVIGAGYWGVNHVRNFHELGVLNMVCDTSRPSLEKIAQKFPGVRVETDITSAILSSDVRGVVIATPAETHYPLARAAMEAGKDVLCRETAHAGCLRGGATGRSGSRARRDFDGRPICSRLPAVLRLRKLIESGEIGALTGTSIPIDSILAR